MESDSALKTLRKGPLNILGVKFPGLFLAGSCAENSIYIYIYIYTYIYIYKAEASKCAQVFPAWILWDVSLDALGVGFQYIQLKSHFWP